MSDTSLTGDYSQPSSRVPTWNTHYVDTKPKSKRHAASSTHHGTEAACNSTMETASSRIHKTRTRDHGTPRRLSWAVRPRRSPPIPLLNPLDREACPELLNQGAIAGASDSRVLVAPTTVERQGRRNTGCRENPPAPPPIFTGFKVRVPRLAMKKREKNPRRENMQWSACWLGRTRLRSFQVWQRGCVCGTLTGNGRGELFWDEMGRFVK